jgi:phage-related protein (TIGR01555 family)
MEMFDSLRNLVSGLGTTRDKASYTEFRKIELSDKYLGTLYDHWIFAKSIDIPADDMVSRWRRPMSAKLDDSDQLETFARIERELNVKQLCNDALKWSRLYGGAGILLDVNDPAEDMSEELDYSKLGKDCIKNLYVVDKTDIWPKHSVTQEMADSRTPLMYEMSSGTKVHPSRFIRFDGVRLPWRELQRNNYWGASILLRIYDEATASKVTLASIASMIFESNIDVVMVKDLFSNIMTGKGRDAILQRFSLANLSKSINKTVLLDMDKEEFKREPLNFSGLPPMISEFLSVVAAAADIPITRFLGQSAKGFNATGEGDLRNYYDMISARQESDLAPQLRQLDEVLTRHVFGTMPEDWSFEFNPLWAMSDLDRATVDKTDAETDVILRDAGIIQSNHAAARIFSTGRYENMESEYVEELKAMDEMEISEDEMSVEDGESETDGTENIDDDSILPGASEADNSVGEVD